MALDSYGANNAEKITMIRSPSTANKSSDEDLGMLRFNLSVNELKMASLDTKLITTIENCEGLGNQVTY